MRKEKINLFFQMLLYSLLTLLPFPHTIVHISVLTTATALHLLFVCPPSEALRSSLQLTLSPNRTCTCTSQSTSTLQTSTPHQPSSGSSMTLCMATGLAARTQMAATSTSLSSTFHRWENLLISVPKAAQLTLKGLSLNHLPVLQSRI